MFWKRSVFQEVPADLKDKADKHIEDILGSDNFKKYIRYIPGDSKKYGKDNYVVSYVFTPYESYGDFPIRADIVNSNIKLEEYSVRLPNCASDPNLCRFGLTANNYKELIEKYGADDSIYIMPPYIYAELCPEKKYLGINYITGEVNDSILRLPNESNAAIWFGPCPVIYY